MGLTLDARAKLVAHGLFQPVCDIMRAAKRKAAVDFEIERDRQPFTDRLDCDVMDRERPITRDHPLTRSRTLSLSSARGSC